jgi:peptidoglycan/LPS O-acetylase OafA/YrhL
LSELDALRGLAALIVLCYHYTYYYTTWFHRSDPPLFEFRMGQYGVHLFFIISGFVIFMTLERTKRSMDFIVSRFSRLFPCYWAAVLLTFTVVQTFTLPGREVPFETALMNLSMLQNWFGVKSVDGVYWTLTVELGFYIAMFVCFLFGQMKRVEDWCLVWLIIMTLTEYLPTLWPAFHWPGVFTVTHLHEVGHLFIAGIIFYNLKTKGHSWQRHATIFLCLVVQCVISDNFWMTPAVAFFFGLFYLFVFDRLGWIAQRPVVFMGTISYSLYLIHQNIGYVIINMLYDAGAPAWARFFVPLGCVLVLASAITFLIEKPAMEWIRNRYRAASQAMPVSPVKA